MRDDPPPFRFVQQRWRLSVRRHWQGMTNVSLERKAWMKKRLQQQLRGPTNQPTDRDSGIFFRPPIVCNFDISNRFVLSLSPSSSGDICSRSRRHFVQIVSDRWRDDRARAELRGGRVHKSQWEMDRSQPRRKVHRETERESSHFHCYGAEGNEIELRKGGAIP